MTDKKSENQTEKTETKENKGMTRREMLKLSAVAGTGIAVGATGLGTILNVVDHVDKALTPKEKAETGVPFYATNQAGIITAQQTYCYIASFDIQTESRQILQDLFVKWTKFADLTASGGVLRDVDNDMLPPNDTGEADGLGISNFTVTLGYGPTFFEKDGKDRFGVKAKKPKYLEKIPHMAYDSLDEAYSDGDLCIQVCADDQQVAFHGIRNFIRLASGVAVVRWIEEGFLSAPKNETPRNLFGFKDGTANVDHDSNKGYKEVVWAENDEPEWMRNGSYLGYRKIQMLIEIWDRSSLLDQEDTFGRKKVSGAPYHKKHEHDKVDPSKLPADSHVRLAKDTKQQMHRRAYSYTNGIDKSTGTIDAGLLFICFTQNPAKQFLPMLSIMGKMDKLNEYTVPIGSAMFACQGGLAPGEVFGEKLL
ncbi:deferrochelatase/peroxidase EfeB [Listeria monocytogenes]|nr:deferrochelatase/peroxidase EfeB [Listeria monocytogenes]EAE2423016.1 deferrochelatase/peroxidase EfeB [Listeria monocytogenes]EAE2429476.1 deferrochelatase/peroxidase EfeB [Listeria monocytogenes]EAE3894077.1 deferrochelatase/peroxidase EfeB [Listeria monocytogenes]EAE7019609.1 deferrochelatase/peroxidase EfeB [Listeria monocytogenes]